MPAERVSLVTQALQSDDGLGGSRLFVWLLSALVVLALAWASFATVDELARGEGRVIPSRQLQVVQNLEGGIVAEILVAEGSLVDVGQPLIKIDDTLFASTFQEKQLKVLELQARAARLRAEIQALTEPAFEVVLEEQIPDLVAQERALFTQRMASLSNADAVIEQQILQRQQRLSQLQAQWQQAKDALKLSQKEVDILRPLLAQGVVSEVELIRAEKDLLQHRGEVARKGFEIPQVEAEITELQRKREQQRLDFRQEAQSELNTILAELPRLSQSRGALEDRVDRTLVRAPVKGTVKQLMVNTIGGVVQPGMDLLSIVPLEDSLLIETRVRPADIARIYPQQAARVKITAYDFARYGALEAEVAHISADSIITESGESFYLVRVKTAKNYLGDEHEPLPIIPGMVAQVDILTGKKRVLDYILKPLLRAREYALSEP
ncbi:MAG: HlyD family type I secretion periplasmic adaptor subunit [Oleiphilaceae bacterium]|nr:HlyD family type I secretion periplasmic adaptor subunit [Oleiphilaceae bacterium]